MIIITESTLNYLYQTEGKETVESLLKQGELKETEKGVKYLKL